MLPLEEITSRFLAARRAAGRAERTLGWYEEELARFASWCRARDAHWWATETIEGYLAAERERGLAQDTIAGRYRSLASFFRWAYKRKLLPDGPCPIDLVEAPKAGRHHPRAVTIQDYDRLLQSIPRGSWVDQRDRLMVTTLFLTGVRRSELVCLMIDDYNVTERTLRVKIGKGGDGRDIPLLPAVIQEFSLYMMVRPAWPTRHVFLSADGAGQVRDVLTGSGVLQRLRVLCRRAGLPPMTPHAFRHGLAMYLLNRKGADMALIQRILGHREIGTTSRIYARWELDGVASVYARLMMDEDGGTGYNTRS